MELSTLLPTPDQILCTILAFSQQDTHRHGGYRLKSACSPVLEMTKAGVESLRGGGAVIEFEKVKVR
jgi:hypothetical protein